MTSNIVATIYYATDNGADIISMSFGGTGYSATTESALDYAYSKGVTLFASTGNSGDSTMQYPVGYSNVIGVGATDNNDNIASFSTYNSSVDISAPGVDIYSTMPTYAVMLNSCYGMATNYDYCDGTSMACPMAAGLGALILSRNPSYGPAKVQSLMQNTAEDRGAAGRDDYFGYGRINAYNTLNSFPAFPAITSFTPAQGATGTVVTISGYGFGATRGSSLVRFGTIKASEYTSWSDTRIKVKVPAPASRKCKLTVTTAGGVSNPVYFKVKPTVTNISPTQGTAGTVVTITGTGFGSTRGASYVKFGGVKAIAYPSWSNTQVKVKVPAGASGAVTLVLVTGGGGSVPISFMVL